MKELDKRNEIIPAEKESKPVAGSAQSTVKKKTIATWAPLVVCLAIIAICLVTAIL